MKHYSTYQSQFIEMFGSESNKGFLEDVVFVKDDCRKPINEGVRSEMKEGELYPYYGATGVVDYINDYITDEELLCVAEDCGNYNAGEESAYIIRGKAWVNNHAHLVKMKDSCDIKYLYYYLKIANLMPYVSGTTRLKLTQKKLREIPVVLPTKDKQTAFVAIAEQADKSKFTHLKSQFIEMFEGDKYPKTRLGDFVSIRTGKLDANASSENGKYPFFTCGVETLKIDDYAFDCEAVLLAGNGEFCVKYYNGKFNAYQRTYVIETLDNNVISVPYLYAWFGQYAKVLRGKAIGGIIKYIKMGDLTEAKISFPPLEVQNSYVAIAQQADKSKFELGKSIESIDAVIKSLINS